MAERLEEDTEVELSSKLRRLWKKKDICNNPVKSHEVVTSDILLSPIEYFEQLFSSSLIEHIVDQTNLYAKQRDVNTTFSTNEMEIRKFIGILICTGICHLPAIEDYWADETRVPQVANVMPSKRFRLLRSLLHFNGNDKVKDSMDRF